MNALGDIDRVEKILVASDVNEVFRVLLKSLKNGYWIFYLLIFSDLI